ncbi:MAG: hypothetical protein H7Y13_06465 [Sphingobacteriaceae bacterium]|nr:hypothetical protein [Sphingobacteriaceae bacterium]
MRAAILSAFLIFFLISFRTTAVSAQSKRNVHSAKVYTQDRKIIRGILTSANDKGVFLLKRKEKMPTLIEVYQIREIQLRRKSKAGTGTTIGFLTGLAASTGAVVALHNEDRKENALRLLGGVLFTFSTTAIGGAISSKPDEVILINGRNEDYLQNLNKLKSFTPVEKNR